MSISCSNFICFFSPNSSIHRFHQFCWFDIVWLLIIKIVKIIKSIGNFEIVRTIKTFEIIKLIYILLSMFVSSIEFISFIEFIDLFLFDWFYQSYCFLGFWFCHIHWFLNFLLSSLITIFRIITINIFNIKKSYQKQLSWWTIEWFDFVPYLWCVGMHMFSKTIYLNHISLFLPEIFPSLDSLSFPPNEIEFQM